MITLPTSSIRLKKFNQQCSILRLTGTFVLVLINSCSHTIFSPSTAYFQQQGASNPFQMMMTGQPGGMQMQATGFQMPQQTGFPGASPFGMQGQQMSHLRPQPTGGIHRPFSSFIPQQMTGMPQSSQSNGFLSAPQPTGFLQPQTTGSNPFRQSMMMPQTTGMQMFGVGGPGPGPGAGAGNAFPQSNPFPSSSWGNGQPAQQGPVASNPTGAMGAFAPSPSFGNMNSNMQNAPPRPASTPLTSFETPKNASTGPPPAQPVKTHQTGTRNPFGRPASPPPPPMPKQPTLMELAMGMGQMNVNGPGQSPTPQPQSQQAQGQNQNQSGAMNGFSFGSSTLNPGATDMSSVASSFSFNGQGNKPVSPPSSTDNKPDTPTFALSSPSFSSFNTSTPTGSTISDSLFSSSASTISTQPTGLTNSTSPPPGQSSLRPQITGMSGLKPFKPSSSFGASLLESLPPIPGSSPNTPAVTGASNGMPGMSGGQNQPNGMSAPSFNPGGGSGFGQQSAGGGGDSQQRSLLGTGLRPQMTGGVANPFRASMFTQQPTGAPQGMGSGMTAGNSLFPGSQSQPSFGGAFNPSQPTGGNLNMGQFGGAFGTQQPGQNGQNGTASLI
jgi:phosphatidylinositol-binding clathrin assembly protein